MSLAGASSLGVPVTLTPQLPPFVPPGILTKEVVISILFPASWIVCCPPLRASYSSQPYPAMPSFCSHVCLKSSYTHQQLFTAHLQVRRFLALHEHCTYYFVHLGNYPPSPTEIPQPNSSVSLASLQNTNLAYMAPITSSRWKLFQSR